MPPSLCSKVLCFVGFLITRVDHVAGFVPAARPFSSATFNLACSAHAHDKAQRGDLRQRRSERLWRAGKTLVAAAAPDDFIDTTIVEEGESYVGVDFERQELRVIFETMDKNNIFYKMLTVDQITEILTLTQALLSVRQMPVDISKLCKGDAMKGKWKLEFSTEERYKLLPAPTDIYNYIYDGSGGGRLDNVIRFYKSWILKNVRAITNYKMDEQGKIVFEFDRIEADLCGFKIPLPKFGSDAGFVEVQYFDGDLWIEAFDAPTMDKSETNTVVNIYRRVGDATEGDKASIAERTGKQTQPQR